MITRYKISNFRIFDEKGVEFMIHPVTILTGENCSGKSSLVKSMLLLRDFFEAVKAEPTNNPAAVQLDFSKPHLKLAGFDGSVHRGSKSDEITFSFKTLADISGSIFRIEYTFKESPVNPAKGVLSRIRISCKDEEILLAETENNNLVIRKLDLSGTVKKAFLDFARGVMIMTSTNESRDGIDGRGWEKYKEESYWRYARHDEYQGLSPVAVKRFEDTDILFYFPLLEQFRGKSREESLDILKNAAKDYPRKYISYLEENRVIVEEDFMSSGFGSFIDYYKARENARLASVESKHESCGSLIGLDSYFHNQLETTLSDINYDGQPVNKEGGKEIVGFNALYDFFSEWQFLETHDSDDYVVRSMQAVSDGQGTYSFLTSRHGLFSVMSSFVCDLVSELVCPRLFSGLVFVGNSFTPIQRLHSFEENTPFVQAVREYQRVLHIAETYRVQEDTFNDSRIWRLCHGIHFSAGSFINKWLKELGIANSLHIEEVDGTGFRILLQKGRGKGSLVNLADEGHGITQIVSILIRIETELIRKDIDSNMERMENTVTFPCPTLAIEEPEVSLHPSLQSKLALIFDDAVRMGVHFIIETHSEYLIRKTQAIVANYETKEQFEKIPFIVYYIQRDGFAYDLEYTESGRFNNSFGPGFFDEASRSSLEILKRERRNKK